MTLDEMIAMREDGRSYHDIGQAAGVTADTARYRIVQAIGVTTTPQRVTEPKTYRLSPDEMAAMRRANATFREIAARAGCSNAHAERTVNAILGRTQRVTTTRWTPDELHELKRLAAMRPSIRWSEIGAILGRGMDSVRDMAIRHGWHEAYTVPREELPPDDDDGWHLREDEGRVAVAMGRIRFSDARVPMAPGRVSVPHTHVPTRVAGAW